MKKTLVTLAALALSFGAYAQGTVNFSTVGGGVNAPVTNGIAGGRVAGTSFVAQLFYGPVGTAPDAFNAATPTANFGTGSFAGYVNAGSGGGTRVLNGIAEGAPALIQIRAWDASLGADWTAALGNWGADSTRTKGLGRSGVIQVTTGSPNGSPPTTPAVLVGLQTFEVVANVPEPSTIALGLLGGLGTLVLIRRRK